ncbi:MAG TPA: hypothetical protein VFG59_12995 [Anaeromyxobacter sp.]|nr:hypothetical protein [Anaeromyxobacter sp.]
MQIRTVSQLLWLVLPLFAIAFGAGALRAAGQRQADPRRRRLFQALWVALLFLGTPLWLVAAATLRLI